MRGEVKGNHHQPINSASSSTSIHHSSNKRPRTHSTPPHPLPGATSESNTVSTLIRPPASAGSHDQCPAPPTTAPPTTAPPPTPLNAMSALPSVPPSSSAAAEGSERRKRRKLAHIAQMTRSELAPTPKLPTLKLPKSCALVPSDKVITRARPSAKFSDLPLEVSSSCTARLQAFGGRSFMSQNCIDYSQWMAELEIFTSDTDCRFSSRSTCSRRVLPCHSSTRDWPFHSPVSSTRRAGPCTLGLRARLTSSAPRADRGLWITSWLSASATRRSSCG
jgi:hypothetical protein